MSFPKLIALAALIGLFLIAVSQHSHEAAGPVLNCVYGHPCA